MSREMIKICSNDKFIQVKHLRLVHEIVQPCLTTDDVYYWWGGGGFLESRIFERDIPSQCVLYTLCDKVHNFKIRHVNIFLEYGFHICHRTNNNNYFTRITLITNAVISNNLFGRQVPGPVLEATCINMLVSLK